MKSSKFVMVVMFAWALLVLCAVPASAKNSCSDTAWLIKAYNDALYRAPSNQEISSWIDPQTLVLRGGADRVETFWALETNQEGLVNYVGGNSGVVSGAFQRVLGRAPTNDELNTIIPELQAQQGYVPDILVIAVLMGAPDRNFDFSNEFRARALALNPAAAACDPNRALVDQIFQVLLGRNPRQDELTRRVNELNGGIDLTDVIFGIAQTPDLNVGGGTQEYWNNVVRDAFSKTLHRAPGPQELVKWSNDLVLSGDGIQLGLYAVLAASDEYCDPQLQTQTIANTTLPAFNLVQPLQQNVVGPPPLIGDNAPPANVVAANGLALNLQNHVVAQDLTIVRLGGVGVVTTPPGSIDSIKPSSATAAGTTAGTPDIGQLLSDLTAEVGGLTTTISTQQATITAQQQQNTQQQSTINSLVTAQFGFGVDSDAAEAARAVAYQEIQLASASANTKLQKKRLELAQAAASRGDNELAEGDPDDALEDYRAAYRHAALILGNKPGEDRN